ncbi:DKNYY domain-containing protein [Dysgonomonas macrotermitis]|uniref:DKNYY family protein n=1 Tax=Dysgonomonas macrotermitis TaxID=1346286 RepID=A0A1M5FAY1_9BACT|nr:DKNYY domain-containing protein [Dysgonomonas macrotermitis]SHF88677.1 DKNYY family protein [Dysgonomonas macrotermitis]
MLGSLFVAISLGQMLVNLLYGNEIEMSESDGVWKFTQKGSFSFRIDLQTIRVFRRSLDEKQNRLNRISINTGDRTLYVNVGTIWKGIVNIELNNKLVQTGEFLAQQMKVKLIWNEGKDRHGKIISNEFSVIHPEIKDREPYVGKKIWGRTVLLVFASLTLMIVAGVYAAVWLTSDDDPGNMVQVHGKELGGSNYYSYNDEVYYLRRGDGYFKVKDADYNTFRPLLKDKQFGGEMGIDTFSVYLGTERIADIDRRTIRYIGAYFIADAKSVYYKNYKLEGADSKTFGLVGTTTHISSKYPYGGDSRNLYYKHYLLKGINPAEAWIFDGIYNYIADNRLVYYRTNRLEGVNAQNFKAEKIDYQLTYATDGKSHFINGIAFPDKVANKLFGTSEVDLQTLKLLAKKEDGYCYHMLFFDKENIYYFDESKQEFICNESFDKELDLTILANGLFSDGKNIYFMIGESVRRRRGGVIAYITKVVKLEDVNSINFRKVKEVSRGIIWTDGRRFFVSGYIEEKHSSSLLWELKCEPAESFSKDDITGIPDYTSFVKIKTKPRKSFLKEDDY